MPTPGAPNPRRAGPALLLLVSVALAAALGWFLRGARQQRPGLDQLAPADRERLVREALRESPAVFQPAWFAPRVGYTLRPNGKIAAWGDRFRANALGYRTHAPEKPPGTIRILFLGDSWTYGMGVRWKQSFPMQLEALANEHRPPNAPSVQAWSLALPGYDTLNELAGLEHWFDLLRPDAVILCPTPNDVDSSNAVTPQGLLARTREPRDDFGDPHSVRYPLPLLDSASFRRRWHIAMGEAAKAESHLREKGIPFFVFFTATWDEPQAHGLMAEGRLQSPYAITPPEITVGEWRNPPPTRHGTPAANRRYARYVYQLVAEALGWPSLESASPPEAARVFRTPPPNAVAAWTEAARKASEAIPTDFEPGPKANEQCLAPMDCESGVAPKASTYLLRRRTGAREVELTLERLQGQTWLYPLEIEVRIADEKETVRGTLKLPAEGPVESSFRLRTPGGSAAVLEVTLIAARASSRSGSPFAESFRMKRIEQR